VSRTTAVVTGGAGFIGSHLTDALLAEGTDVVVLDDLSSGRPANLPAQASLEVADLVDRATVDRVMDAATPARVFHVAAQASVTASVADPARDCEVNVVGTLNVLEAAHRHQAPVVFTSTGGALYGNDAPLPTSEECIPVPLSPYGASKWAGEAYVLTWARASGLPHAVCRLGNVYGARQSPHGEAGVVAIFSHCLWSGQAPTVYGHGRPTRDYVHVSDVVDALRRASGTAGLFNVGTGIETDVMGVLDGLQRVAGTSLQPELAPLRAGELERSCLDTTHAADALGWRAQVELAGGLEATYRALTQAFEAEAGSPAAVDAGSAPPGAA
jgi:UDP-glucose 4-epimerase